jgi:hypothetical protein
MYIYLYIYIFFFLFIDGIEKSLNFNSSNINNIIDISEVSNVGNFEDENDDNHNLFSSGVKNNVKRNMMDKRFFLLLFYD